MLDGQISKENNLDNYLQQAAKLLNKKVGGCETPEIRCETTKSNVDVVQDKLNETLSLLENNDALQYLNIANQWLNLYRCVNLAEMKIVKLQFALGNKFPGTEILSSFPLMK